MLHCWISAASSVASEPSLTAMPLFTKGLFTTLFGLVGVFLVLTLFFVSIKLIQKTGRKAPETKE